MPLLYEPNLHVVLYQPEIPYNCGSVGRTCVALGAKLWLVRPLGFRVDDYHLRRAGLDYWQWLEWEVVDDWRGLQSKLAQHRFWLFSKKATHHYADIQFEQGDVLVFGAESTGLPDSLREQYSEHTLRIPTRGDVRSLNLSCSVAIAGFEAIRQWGAAGGPTFPPDVSTT